MSLDITVPHGTLAATLLLAAAAQQNPNEPRSTVAPTERIQSPSA